MNTSFRITALSPNRFTPMFELDDGDLARYGARRVIVDAKPGYPCRISLEDAERGERVILLPFTHHGAKSPYRASGPIFIREGVEQAVPDVDVVPEAVRRRLLSIRAYDRAGTMIDGDVTEGVALEACVGRMFADLRAGYLHVHNAKPGCYFCRIDRAPV